MEILEQLMLQNNVKPTAMRLLVLQFLFIKKIAVSLSNIEDYFDNCDRTTLYRTIKTFVESGIAHQIDDGTGIAKYALCEEHCNCELGIDLHLHFHCSSCNETVCLTAHKIPTINLPEGYEAADANLVIKGICDKCS